MFSKLCLSHSLAFSGKELKVSLLMEKSMEKQFTMIIIIKNIRLNIVKDYSLEN